MFPVCGGLLDKRCIYIRDAKDAGHDLSCLGLEGICIANMKNQIPTGGICSIKLFSFLFVYNPV